jgi:hypothetical protein
MSSRDVKQRSKPLDLIMKRKQAINNRGSIRSGEVVAISMRDKIEI